MTDEERKKRRALLILAAMAYADGFAEGAGAVAEFFHLEDHVPTASLDIQAKIEERAPLIDQAIDNAKAQVENAASEIRAETPIHPAQHGTQIEAEAQRVSETRGAMIAEVEHATGRFDGAKAVLDESDLAFEIRFPHLDLQGDEECPICAGIREGAPYTRADAKGLGYPFLPHPRCDHAWIVVPFGLETNASPIFREIA